jgi:hypothetical protein
MVNTKKKLGLIVLIVILVSSIFISSGLLNPNRNSTVLGIAYLNGSLAGATVTVTDSNNNVLASYPAATLDSGVFMVSVPWGLFQWSAPKEVNLKISGGTINEEPFNGTIIRVIDNFDESQVYSVNAITTIVATYRSTHAQVSLADAEAKVSAFIAIPNSTNIQTVENNADAVRLYFDHYVFMREAVSKSGFEPFVSTLISEMDQGVATHSFKGLEPVGGLFGSLLGWFGGNLANGAVSYLGGQAMGWAMNMLGYQSADDKIMEKLEQISNKLNEMDQKLDSISNELVSLSNQISELKSALSATETDLSRRISEIASYDPVSKIQSSYSQLDIYAKCKPGEVSAATINGWATSVLDPNTGTYYALTSLDNFIEGHVIGSESGLLDVLCDSALNKLSQSPGDHYGRDYRTKVSNVATGMSDYFQQLLYAEMKGLTIICEAHHARNETAPVAQYIQQYWLPRLQRQVDLYVNQMERFAVLSEAKYFLEFPNMGSIPADKQALLQSRWQQVYHMNVPSVAEFLPQVDILADQVLNGTGKFTARVLYIQPAKQGSTPRDVMPVFQNMQTGQTYSAAGSLKKFADSQSTGTYYLYRYTLNAPAGNYKLVSPTNTFSGPTAPGWKINLDVSLEGWVLQDALTMSQGSYLGQQGFIQVANDVNGHPYGYWGGQWLDVSIA